MLEGRGRAVPAVTYASRGTRKTMRGRKTTALVSMIVRDLEGAAVPVDTATDPASLHLEPGATLRLRHLPAFRQRQLQLGNDALADAVEIQDQRAGDRIALNARPHDIGRCKTLVRFPDLKQGEPAEEQMTETARPPHSPVGTWKLLSFQYEFEDSDQRDEPLGANPVGYLVLTEGRLITLMTARERATDAAPGELLGSMIAYSGLYRLQGDDCFITTVDSAWQPAWIGTEQFASSKWTAKCCRSCHRSEKIRNIRDGASVEWRFGERTRRTCDQANR